jgi:predicted enzyme related to lactoylglutathione lyase
MSQVNANNLAEDKRRADAGRCILAGWGAMALLHKENCMPDPIPGQVSFMEVGSRDLATTRGFFGAVFGWPSHDEGPWFETPNGRAGIHGDDPSPQIYVYFHVADLEAAAARVRAAGGAAEDVVDEPGFGRFVTCRDPGGLQFGLHQAAI